MNKNKNSIYLFTRDLRLQDNTSLIMALKESKYVIPIFIFNTEQISNTNKYKSNNCIQFMCECLDELNDELGKYNSKLYIFYGDPINILERLIKHNDIDALYMNNDYTQFAIKRLKNITKLFDKYNKNVYSYDDYLLIDKIDNVKNKKGDVYVKFTPFYNTAKKIKVRDPMSNRYKNYISKNYKINGEYKKNYHNFYEYNENMVVKGGRNNAIKILKNINKFKNYNKERDEPIIDTTHLSPYLKFNVVSIREVYHIFKNKLPSNTKLIVQLYWRDFYMILLYHYPYILKSNMNNYDIKWKNNSKLFNLWKKGITGYPIIDAGMRQLNETGWMHNRVRMIVSSFLVKIMHIDWRYGEKYFAQQLVDYDPYNNNGGWQWSAGTGTDSQPYFRYFNPFRQSIEHDKDAKYIKKWIPELQNIDAYDIHRWDEKYEKYKKINYPKPIFDNLSEQLKITIKMYKQ